MSKGGVSATPKIDFNALAATQGAVNQDTAVAQSVLNNARTTSPLGTSNWEYVTDPNTGVARWQLNQALSPQSQNVLNQQQGLVSSIGSLANATAPNIAPLITTGTNIGTNVVGGLTPQLPTGPINFNNGPALPTNIDYSGTPALPTNINYSGINVPTGLNLSGAPNAPTNINYSGLPTLPTSTTNFNNEVTRAQNAAYNTQTGYLNPQFAQKKSDLTQQLADEGINPGTVAYDRAQGDLARQETLAYQQAKDAAVAAGNQEQATLYGENLSSRQQGATEAQAQFNAEEQARQQAAAEAQAGAGIGLTGAQLQSGQAQAQFGAGLSAEQQAAAQRQAQFAAELQARQQAGNETLQSYESVPNLVSSLTNAGTTLASSGVNDYVNLGSLGNFNWASGLPTYGGQQTTVPTTNVVGAAQTGNEAARNTFASGYALNNQLFNGLGSLGGAIGGSNLLFGSGGLGGALGINPTTGLLGGLFGAAGGTGAGAFGTDAGAAILNALPFFG